MALLNSLKRAAKHIPLLHRAYLKLTGEGRVRAITRGHLAGLKYRQYRWSTPQQDLVETNWDDELAPAFIRLIKGKRCFFDVGANWGFYVLLASKYRDAAGCRIVAFEPHPQSAAELRTQIALNRVADAYVDQAALSDRSGTIEFADTGSAIGQKLAAVNDSHQSARTITVPTLTLDDAAARHQPPDLVKIDVEGAENLVLAGATRLLQTHRPTLLIEVHGADKSPALYDTLARHGYRCETTAGVPITDQTYHHHVICLP
jgi:FkbM family methyltransferase